MIVLLNKHNAEMICNLSHNAVSRRIARKRSYLPNDRVEVTLDCPRLGIVGYTHPKDQTITVLLERRSEAICGWFSLTPVGKYRLWNIGSGSKETTYLRIVSETS